MEQKLIKIITSLRNVIKAEELNISDNTLFSEACSFLRGEFASESKFQSRSFKPSPINNALVKNVTGPTDRQMGLLRKNIKRLETQGIVIDDIKTKLEASKIIDSLMKNG